MRTLAASIVLLAFACGNDRDSKERVVDDTGEAAHEPAPDDAGLDEPASLDADAFGEDAQSESDAAQSSPADAATHDGSPAPQADAATHDGSPAPQADAATAPTVCPSVAPYDESNTALVAECTRPIAVAVGNALRRLSSFDGKTWQFEAAYPDQGNDQNENSHRDVLIANGIIVITGDGGVLASRDAGASYRKVLDLRNHDSALAFFQGAFWVVGTRLTARSTDGFSWESWQDDKLLPGALRGGWDCTSMAASADTLVAVTGRNNARRVFDGKLWTQAMFGPEYGTLSALAFGGGHFALVGYGCCDTAAFAGLRAASTRGSDWSVRTNASSGSSYRFSDVLWDGTRFVASASQYDRRSYVSSDGLSYTARSSNVGIGALAKLGDQYLGSSDGALLMSADAVGWSETYRAAEGRRWGIVKIRTGRVLK